MSAGLATLKALAAVRFQTAVPSAMALEILGFCNDIDRDFLLCETHQNQHYRNQHHRNENRRIAHTEFSPAFDAARTERLIPVMH